jgi:hypothetical protein
MVLRLKVQTEKLVVQEAERVSCLRVADDKSGRAYQT